MARPHYEILEHTADVGLIAHGRTPAEVFEHTAEGMYALMTDLAALTEREQREVRVSAADREHLLVAWLLELLFLTETEGLLFRRFAVDLEDGAALRGRAFGEPFDPGRHETGVAVKAVTHHLLELREDPDGFHARVLFDI